MYALLGFSMLTNMCVNESVQVSSGWDERNNGDDYDIHSSHKGS